MRWALTLVVAIGCMGPTLEEQAQRDEEARERAARDYREQQEAERRAASDAEADKVCNAAAPGSDTWSACLLWRQARQQSDDRRAQARRDEELFDRDMRLRQQQMDLDERERRRQAVQDIIRATQAPYQRQPLNCTSRKYGDRVTTDCY